ncbi:MULTISPECIES: hypothetical protein [unclassified Streptomyces]|uniref:hypothetical protein n=1 Tax=unclassified Streptomyces TaxID=2593676 RepID=UPI00278C5601|nr:MULTISPECIES: hypothetical protein [unclassified Streptomyces]
MTLTERTLRRAWHDLAKGTDLLDDAMLPPIGTSPEEYGRQVPSGEGLFLVLDTAGTVHGHIGPYREVFATRDLDEVLYFAAEDAIRGIAAHIASRSPGTGPVANLVTGQAQLMDRVGPAWGRRFRGGGAADVRPEAPCGLDPYEGFAWIAGGWRDQDPYTHLTFFRGEGVTPEAIALAHGADPAQVAAGTRLAELRDMDGGAKDYWDLVWQTCCFGRSGDWVFLLHHETPPGVGDLRAALDGIGVRESVHLSAASAKAIYTFDYLRDGRRVDDDWGILELIWYERGRAPYFRGGQLDFVNRAVRRAELDHPEVTDKFALYFHALQTAFGLGLPRRDIEEGSVHAALWARRDG